MKNVGIHTVGHRIDDCGPTKVEAGHGTRACKKVELNVVGRGILP